MISIDKLPESQLYMLKSIDPVLNKEWRNILISILPTLDEASQNIVYKNILSKKNISYNLTYQPPKPLKAVLTNSNIANKELKSVAIHMLKLVESTPKNLDANALADRIEAMIDYLDRIDIGDSIHENKNRNNVKKAFLYDLANWIEKVELNTKSGLRQIDDNIAKEYLKQVYIKEKIQNRDFRVWDSTDLSFQQQDYLPIFIRKAARLKKFVVVEGEQSWFLIGRADKPNQNPYSFRRFLHEDISGEADSKFVYLSHIVIRKNQLSNEDYLEHISYCLTRLYTLDIGVSETVINFVDEMERFHRDYLITLLQKPLAKDGYDSEQNIETRMIEYEQQFSILILNKLPNIIQFAIHDKNDQDYLFYYLDKLLKRMLENIQDFRLQPFSIYSNSSEIMTVRLIIFRHLINKIYNSLSSDSYKLNTLNGTNQLVMDEIKEQLKITESNLEELNNLKAHLTHFNKAKTEGNFWQKIKAGKAPKYSLEDIKGSENEAKKKLFMSIVRSAKTNPEDIIYLEFDCNEIINENYRHYGLANGKLGVSRLPIILRLPEDRSMFDLSLLRKSIEHDAFLNSKSF